VDPVPDPLVVRLRTKTREFFFYNTVYRTLSGESRSVDPETVEDWRNSHYCKEQKNLCDIHNADETLLFFIPQLSKNFTF
jgi:hypothetical protein